MSAVKTDTNPKELISPSKPFRQDSFKRRMSTSFSTCLRPKVLVIYYGYKIKINEVRCLIVRNLVTLYYIGYVTNRFLIFFFQ